MRVQVNGEPLEVRDNFSIAELIASLDLKAEQVAIELNQNVVRRAQWETTILQEDDKVEIVHFVGGGSNAKLLVCVCSYGGGSGKSERS